MNNLKLTNGTYAKILGFYLFSLVFLYPYGITFGSVSFRIPDIIVLILITLGSVLMLKKQSISPKVKLLWFIAPFLIFEIFFHLIGVIQYPNISAHSSLRVVFLYLPFLFIFINFNYQDFIVLKNSFDKNLKISLILTFAYSLIQLGVLYGFLSNSLLLQQYLQPFAVDPHFNITDGLRVSGFFNNGIGLSIFALGAFSYFIAKAFFNFERKYIVFTILSLLLIVFSSTRVAMIVAMLILLIDFLIVPNKLKNKLKILFNFTVVSGISLLIIEYTIGIEQIFGRMIRLSEGFQNDFSFSYRADFLWPSVLRAVEDMPFGTLVQPFNIVGLIDSGYISYYAQGKWLFLIAMLLFLFGLLVYSYVTFKRSTHRWVNLFLMNFSIYLIIEAVFHNPMRNPLILFFIFFGLISIYYSTPRYLKTTKESKQLNI